MALLRIRNLSKLCSPLWTRGVFYREFPKLTNLPFSRFYPLHVLASVLDTDINQALTYLIRSERLFGMDVPDLGIRIHPNGVIALAKNKSKSLLRAEIKSSPKV